METTVMLLNLRLRSTVKNHYLKDIALKLQWVLFSNLKTNFANQCIWIPDLSLRNINCFNSLFITILQWRHFKVREYWKALLLHSGLKKSNRNIKNKWLSAFKMIWKYTFATRTILIWTKKFSSRIELLSLQVKQWPLLPPWPPMFPDHLISKDLGFRNNEFSPGLLKSSVLRLIYVFC